MDDNSGLSSDDLSDDIVSDEVRAELDEVFADTGAVPKPSRRLVSVDPDSSNDESSDLSSGVSGDSARSPLRERLTGRVRGLIRRDESVPTPQPSAKPTSSPKVTTGPTGKKRVVISDDDSGPAPKPSGAARFRQRRIAVRRAAGRRRLRWFTVVGIVIAALPAPDKIFPTFIVEEMPPGMTGVVIAAILVVLLLLTSPILSIRSVDVEGNVYTNPTLLGEVISDLKGEPILTADVHGAELRLLAIPWVRDVEISTHLPSRVTIQIVEREPLAFYRAVDGFNRVIDRDGRVLDVIEGDPVDYTAIRGTGPNLSAGDFVGQPFLGATQLINALPAELSVRLIAMSVSAEGEVSMTLTNEVEVLFGRPDDFQAKLVGVVNEIKKQGSNKYATIDVSSGEPSVR
ncbi:MAG: FtsQ-type POTRA domain-containing protein [Ilumatobacteraceae bacterium]